MTTDAPVRRPVLEVLHVADCPTYPEASALERVRAGLGIGAELRTILIADQAAAERARFSGSPTVRVDGRAVVLDRLVIAAATPRCRPAARCRRSRWRRS
jgi:hypothetical protein